MHSVWPFSALNNLHVLICESTCFSLKIKVIRVARITYNTICVFISQKQSLSLQLLSCYGLLVLVNGLHAHDTLLVLKVVFRVIFRLSRIRLDWIHFRSILILGLRVFWRQHHIFFSLESFLPNHSRLRFFRNTITENVWLVNIDSCFLLNLNVWIGSSIISRSWRPTCKLVCFIKFSIVQKELLRKVFHCF